MTNGLDLDLLLTLEVLLEHRNVTRAAAVLGLTQSAVSQRLRRLREALGDPLLVAGGQTMTLTERARLMQEPLRTSLQSLRAAVSLGASFDPAKDERTFTIACSDVGELVVMPGLMRRLGQQAPGVTLRMRMPGEDVAYELQSARIDLGVGLFVEDRSGLRARVLGHEQFVVCCRPDHPVLAPGCTLEDYLRCRHLLIAPMGDAVGVVDQLLAEQGLARRLGGIVGHFAAAPFVASSTDLVLTCPSTLARTLARYVPLQILTPPLPLPTFPVSMVWHERSQLDEAHRWLRAVSAEETQSAFGWPVT
jgi:DNA-binding transcriptional LysR family regulator